MAIFNEILEGRFNRALQKLTSIKGPPPVRQLGSEILAGWQLPLGNEFRYLEQWNRYASSFSIAAAAGFNSAFRCINPATSGVIAVFEKIFVSNFNAAANEFRLEGWNSTAGVVALANNLSGTETRFDARSGGGTALSLSFQNSSVLGPIGRTPWFVNLGVASFADAILTDDEEPTLLPGDSFQLRSVPLNASLNGIVWWRERPLSDSEFK